MTHVAWLDEAKVPKRHKHKVCSILDTGYLALRIEVVRIKSGNKHKAWSICEY